VTESQINLAVVGLYASYLFIPGYLLLTCWGAIRDRFLLSFALSLSLIVFSLTLCSLLNTEIIVWIIVLHVLIFLSAGSARVISQKQRRLNSLVRNEPPSENWSQETTGLILLLMVVATYHTIAGPYTEIPSDIWKHLARIGAAAGAIESNLLNDALLLPTNTLHNSSIYSIHAVVTKILEITPLDLVFPITLFTTCVFSGTLYCFSLNILENFDLSSRARVIGSLTGAILTFATLGTATFAYARYYAYFPTIFAIPLLFASATLLLDFLLRSAASAQKLLLLPVLLTTAWYIHRQEALLTVVLLFSIVFVRAIRSYLPNSNLSSRLRARAQTSGAICILLLALFLIYTFSTRTMNSWDHTPHVVDAGRFLSILHGFPIDNPTFRFWDTLGYFGLAVYGWSVLKWRIIVRSDFLTAGALLPLVTNLNPLYAVFFLHFGTASTLWRTAYLMPLGLMAATLITVTFFSERKKWTLLRRLATYATIGTLIIAIAPWNFQGYFNRTSRIPSLLSIDQTSGIGLWHDLISEVQEVQNHRYITRIITDSVTRFVLYSATRGKIYSWAMKEYFPAHKVDFKHDFRTSDFSNTLLIINKRNGVITQSAQHAGHWPSRILQVARSYPRDLERFIAQHPDNFELLWHRNRIRMYLIHPFIR